MMGSFAWYDERKGFRSNGLKRVDLGEVHLHGMMIGKGSE